MSKTVLLSIGFLVFSNFGLAQKELNFSALINYAPNNFTTGSGNFTSPEKIESISQSPVLNIGFQYNGFKIKSIDFGVGLEYSFVRAKSNDYFLESNSSSSNILIPSNDIAVRNYLFPKVSATYHYGISRSSGLRFSGAGKIGIPFLSYDKIETAKVDPQFGFVNGQSMTQKINKYQGDDFGENFGDGLLFGGEFSCLYYRRNRKKSKILVGPNINVFALTSANDLKFSLGLKFVYSYSLSDGNQNQFRGPIPTPIF